VLHRRTFLRSLGLAIAALSVKPVSWFRTPLSEPTGLYDSVLIQDRLREYAKMPLLEMLSKGNKGIVEDWKFRYPEFQEVKCTQYG